jgi:regulator of replication initiation timing
MAETKEEIAAERDDLRAATEDLTQEIAGLREENERLRAAVSRETVPGPAAARHTFVLSEGAREELARTGMTNIGGKLRTADEVREMLGDGQAGVDLGDAVPDKRTVDAHSRQENAGTYGVDYVYPSVEPGLIDPAVAGTPGINGPSA